MEHIDYNPMCVMFTLQKKKHSPVSKCWTRTDTPYCQSNMSIPIEERRWFGQGLYPTFPPSKQARVGDEIGMKNRPSFTGKERDSESGLYYFGARYHDPTLLTSWTAVDPLSDKYPNLSPYAYCAWTRPTGGHEHLLIKFNLVNNPMKLVNPNGCDIWEINKQGELLWKQLSGTDIVKASDGTAVELSAGVLKPGHSYTNNGDGHLLLYLDKNNGGDEGQNLFEFMADHSDVEYSLIRVSQVKDGGENNSCSILTSSFEKNGDDFGSEFTHQLQSSVIEHTHNHPSGYLPPSTSLTNPDTEGVTDMDFSNAIRLNNSTCRFFIYGKDQGGRYREYNNKGLSGNYINSIYNKEGIYKR